MPLGPTHVVGRRMEGPARSRRRRRPRQRDDSARARPLPRRTTLRTTTPPPPTLLQPRPTHPCSISILVSPTFRKTQQRLFPQRRAAAHPQRRRRRRQRRQQHRHRRRRRRARDRSLRAAARRQVVLWPHICAPLRDLGEGGGGEGQRKEGRNSCPQSLARPLSPLDRTRHAPPHRQHNHNHPPKKKVSAEAATHSWLLHPRVPPLLDVRVEAAAVHMTFPYRGFPLDAALRCAPTPLAAGAGAGPPREETAALAAAARHNERLALSAVKVCVCARRGPEGGTASTAATLRPPLVASTPCLSVSALDARPPVPWPCWPDPHSYHRAPPPPPMQPTR